MCSVLGIYWWAKWHGFAVCTELRVGQKTTKTKMTAAWWLLRAICGSMRVVTRFWIYLRKSRRLPSRRWMAVWGPSGVSWEVKGDQGTVRGRGGGNSRSQRAPMKGMRLQWCEKRPQKRDRLCKPWKGVWPLSQEHGMPSKHWSQSHMTTTAFWKQPRRILGALYMLILKHIKRDITTYSKVKIKAQTGKDICPSTHRL